MNEFALQKQPRSLMFVDPAAVAAAETAKARIQAAYMMALQKPRNEDQSRVNILQACKRSEFAEKVEFSKPVGNRKIRGLSARFAELALTEWGNILSDNQMVYEDDFTKRIKITILDLEKNTSFSKEITLGKTVERKSKKGREVVGERLNTYGEKVYIVNATEDELNNKENALISKAVRNEGLRLIPSDIKDEAIETARRTMANQFSEDPKAGKKKIIDSFASIFVKPKDLEGYLGHSLDTVSPKELEDLRSIYLAIRDNEASWTDYIAKPDENGTDSKDLTDKIKAKKSAAKEKPAPKPEKEPEKKDFDYKKALTERYEQDPSGIDAVLQKLGLENLPSGKKACEEVYSKYLQGG